MVVIAVCDELSTSGPECFTVFPSAVIVDLEIHNRNYNALTWTACHINLAGTEYNFNWL